MITLRIREKPSNPMNMSQQQNLLLGQRTFYFLVTNWLLKDIDHEIPSCQKKFLCHNINHACSPGHKKIRTKMNKNDAKEDTSENCLDNDWIADVIVYDNVTGLKSVQNVQDGTFVDNNLVIGEPN